MNILEITLENPIRYTEIVRLKSEIETVGNCSFLIIDSGKHEFVSLDVIKYFREQMKTIETQLLKFEKIAFIHPPEYRNESSEPERYNYFTSRVKAQEWFSERTEQEDLHKMTIKELGQLFPIIITDYSDRWSDLYKEEAKLIIDSFSQTEIMRIDHIGSTAIPGLKAKPTIDILFQVAENIDIQRLKDTFKSLGYLINEHPENPDPHLTFVKGYTSQGIKGQAYHVHIRYEGDWDEIRFKDYLIKHEQIAKEYEILKLGLAKKYPNDREAYTDSKTEWIKGINNLTRK